MNEVERMEWLRRQRLQAFTEGGLAIVSGVGALVIMQILPYQITLVRLSMWIMVFLIGLLYAILLRRITGYKGLPRLLWMVGLTPYYPFGRLFGYEFSAATGWAALFSLVLSYFGWILLYGISIRWTAQRN